MEIIYSTTEAIAINERGLQQRSLFEQSMVLCVVLLAGWLAGWLEGIILLMHMDDGFNEVPIR